MNFEFVDGHPIDPRRCRGLRLTAARSPRNKFGSATTWSIRSSCITCCREFRDTRPGSHRPRPATAPPLLRRPAPRFVPLPSFFFFGGEGPCGPGLRETSWALVSVAPLALLLEVLRPFAPAALPAFLATMASADFSFALTKELSPGQGAVSFPSYRPALPRTSGWTLGFD